MSVNILDGATSDTQHPTPETQYPLANMSSVNLPPVRGVWIGADEAGWPRVQAAPKSAPSIT